MKSWESQKKVIIIEIQRKPGRTRAGSQGRRFFHHRFSKIRRNVIDCSFGRTLVGLIQTEGTNHL